jgi:hypothetical protein
LLSSYDWGWRPCCIIIKKTFDDLKKKGTRKEIEEIKIHNNEKQNRRSIKKEK